MHPLLLHHYHHLVYFNLRNPCMINQNQRCAGVSVSVTRKSGREIAVSVLPVPARDRVIDFGKYKGKMLGSLPSSYLRWVSKNLRARDFEEWANLADQVLRDPIYRDRIEWEFALNVLNGNSTTATTSSSSLAVRGAVSELRDISERFGWDDLDKVAWSKVDFDLLGTSKGGRIPRLVNLTHTEAADSQPKRPPSPTTTTVGSTSRRMERRERQKTRLTTRRPQPQQQINNGLPVADIEHSIHVKDKDDDKNIAIANPFPGRQTLLQKVVNHRNGYKSHDCTDTRNP